MLHGVDEAPDEGRPQRVPDEGLGKGQDLAQAPHRPREWSKEKIDEADGERGQGAVGGRHVRVRYISRLSQIGLIGSRHLQALQSEVGLLLLDRLPLRREREGADEHDDEDHVGGQAPEQSSTLREDECPHGGEGDEVEDVETQAHQGEAGGDEQQDVADRERAAELQDRVHAGGNAEHDGGILVDGSRPEHHLREEGHEARRPLRDLDVEEVLGDGIDDDDGEGAHGAVEELSEELVVAEDVVDGGREVEEPPTADLALVVGVQVGLTLPPE